MVLILIPSTGMQYLPTSTVGSTEIRFRLSKIYSFVLEFKVFFFTELVVMNS
jgi:hypothetical protein